MLYTWNSSEIRFSSAGPLYSPLEVDKKLGTILSDVHFHFDNFFIISTILCFNNEYRFKTINYNNNCILFSTFVSATKRISLIKASPFSRASLIFIKKSQILLPTATLSNSSKSEGISSFYDQRLHFLNSPNAQIITILSVTLSLDNFIIL